MLLSSFRQLSLEFQQPNTASLPQKWPLVKNSHQYNKPANQVELLKLNYTLFENVPLSWIGHTSYHRQNWISSSGILKRSKRPGFHYWCAVNDRRGWADCVSFHALSMAKQRASVCEPASLYHKRKQKRVGQGENEGGQLPSPCSNSLCSFKNRQSNSEEPSSTVDATFQSSFEVCQTWKLLCETLRSWDWFLRRANDKKMYLWFGWTYLCGLWCNVHIIMATHIPEPQSATASTKRHHLAAKPLQALPKSNCLVENPLPLCPLAVHTSPTKWCQLWCKQVCRQLGNYVEIAQDCTYPW